MVGIEYQINATGTLRVSCNRLDKKLKLVFYVEDNESEFVCSNAEILEIGKHAANTGDCGNMPIPSLYTSPVEIKRLGAKLIEWAEMAA